MNQPLRTDSADRDLQERRSQVYGREHFGVDLRGKRVELTCSDGQDCLIASHMRLVDERPQTPPPDPPTAPPVKPTPAAPMQKRLTPALRKQILKMSAEGKSLAEISEAVEFSTATVSKVRREAREAAPAPEKKNSSKAAAAPAKASRTHGEILELIHRRLPFSGQATGFDLRPDGSVSFVLDEIRYVVRNDLTVEELPGELTDVPDEFLAALVSAVLRRGAA